MKVICRETYILAPEGVDAAADMLAIATTINVVVDFTGTAGHLLQTRRSC